MVDGAITSPSSGIKVGFGDTTKYMTVMPLANRVSWLVNKEAWDSLPADLQQILTEEAKATGDAIQANWDAEEVGVAQLVADAGMTFVPPSEEFQAAVTKLLRPVWGRVGGVDQVRAGGAGARAEGAGDATEAPGAGGACPPRGGRFGRRRPERPVRA